MQKQCVQCMAEFVIEPQDIAFYTKVSPVFNGVTYNFPEPTHCPDCRMRRRMTYRNERTLYRRPCDVTGKQIISVFSPNSPYKTCDKNHWYSDEFDPLAYGRDYDFTKPFFEQFHQLTLDMPFPSARVETSENCEYNNDMKDCKDCYMCTRTHMSQGMMYCYRGNTSEDCLDCTQITRCSLLKDCIQSVQCNQSRLLYFCTDCSDSAYLFDCRNCNDCFMSSGLRNKQYVWRNQQLNKEGYQAKLAALNVASYEMSIALQQEFEELIHHTPHEAQVIIKSEDCTGDNLFECKNCHDCFGVQRSQDCRYCWDNKQYTDVYDAYSGGRDSELVYETTSVANCYNARFIFRAFGSKNVLYSFHLADCQDVFGCFGLQRAQYCILNKQYTKEQYEELMPRIIEHMQSTGEWGEYFPALCCPYAYNETVANDYFPLTQPQMQALGWRCQEPDNSIPDVAKVINAADLPDSIADIPDDILNWALRCNVTQRPYRVTKEELQFYRKHGYCVPRVHPDVRYQHRLHHSPGRHLHPDVCDKCRNNVMTTHKEHRPKTIYCNACYLSAVY